MNFLQFFIIKYANQEAIESQFGSLKREKQKKKKKTRILNLVIYPLKIRKYKLTFKTHKCRGLSHQNSATTR